MALPTIKPVSEIERYLKVLVYGDPGVGKTSFAASAQEHPDMRETLIVNIEGGILSIANTGAQSTEQITDVDDVEDLMRALAMGAEGFRHYKTVVLDSGTELQTLDLENIAAGEVKKKKRENLDALEIQDYGKSTARLKRIFRHFRDLEMNVVITALAKRVMPQAVKGKPKSDEPLAVYPQFTEKLSNSLMGYMDAVWYMYLGDEDGNGEVSRNLLTQATGPFAAKTRGHRFSAEIGRLVTNPNLATLYTTLLATEGQQP